MANKLYQSMGGQAPTNPYGQLVNTIKQFGKTVQGDPRDAVQQLLNSGKMTQQEFNKYSQMAKQLVPFFGR